MIQSIVDYRVGICPFTVNKCDVTDTLLLHGATEVSFQSVERTECRSEDHDVAGITARICTTLNTLETYQIDHSRVQPLASLKYSSAWPNPRTHRKLAYMFC